VSLNEPLCNRNRGLRFYSFHENILGPHHVYFDLPRNLFERIDKVEFSDSVKPVLCILHTLTYDVSTKIFNVFDIKPDPHFLLLHQEEFFFFPWWDYSKKDVLYCWKPSTVFHWRNCPLSLFEVVYVDTVGAVSFWVRSLLTFGSR
jgi:hypothetical protein